MNRGWSMLGGLGLGAGAVYLLDPDKGARRRALIRDQAVRAAQVTQDFVGKASRDLGNRMRGTLGQTKSALSAPPTDDVLKERVRAKMGRYVSHPRAVEVEARQGRISLRGPILEDEAPVLMRAVAGVRGVTEVENRLEPHRRDENVPALQGGTRPPGEPAEWAQRNWTPGLRLVAGLAGAAAMAYALGRRRSTPVQVKPNGPQRSPRHSRTVPRGWLTPERST